MKLNGLEKEFKTNKSGEIVDFKQVNKDGYTPLMIALIHNKERKLNLNKEHWYYLIKQSDLKQLDIFNRSPLMLAIYYNSLSNLKLEEKNWDYLIKSSDLRQVNSVNKKSSLLYALQYNKKENLNKEQWKYLIKNSDLSLIKDKEQLIELKKIQSEFLNADILYKINIKEDIIKKVKI